jgi:hypothetical protein
MNAKQVYFAMIGAIAGVVILGFTTLVFGDKLLSSKSNELLNLRLQSQVLNNQQTALVKAKHDVIKYTPLNNIAETVVPQEKDQALVTREIVNYATEANISLSSITFPASNLGGNILGTSTGGAPVHSTAIKTAPSQLLPVPGISGIDVLPITVQSNVNKPIGYSQLSQFLKSLEQDRHTAEVSELTITPSDSVGQQLSFEVVINIYIKI